jgi:tetratricopeptide (TPR) repeat protein
MAGVGWWSRAGAALCIAAAAFGGAVAHAGDRKGIDEVRALIAAGKGADALARARQVLVACGDDADALEVASDASVAAGCADEALWFAHAARCAAIGAGRADRAAALAAKAESLEPPTVGERAPLDAAASSQLEAAKTCVRKRYWVNAVQILSRLESTPLGEKAEAELAKIYANKQAVTALSESSVSVPRTVTDRKARAKAAKDDAKHATWDTALSLETPNYTIVTDAGHDVAQSVAVAMEPMNRFYRRVFRTKDKPGEKPSKGGDVKHCTVRVYRSKAEMEAIAKPQRNVLGFYSPADNSVTVYDPRSEGMPLSSMWTTLFHEASHQFTEMISGQLVPSWLNEGTASYFEGALLRADGRVDTNLVPSYRLQGAIEALRTGAPTLEQVVSYAKPESYPDEYYPVGWSLVYFLRNYQDAKLQKVYEKPYSALLDSYRGPGGLPSLERFVKYVITDAKQPGVPDFAAFADLYRKWLQDLDYFHGGPPSAAGDFAARAQKHLALSHKEEAEDDFRFALEKNPDFVPALTGLGDLLAGLQRKDEAISCWRRAAEAVRRDPGAAGFSELELAGADEAAKTALARIAAVDREVGLAFGAMDADLAAKAIGQADRYAEASMPRNALRVLDAASMLLSGALDVERRRRVIAQESGVDVLLPRPLDLRPGADRVWASPGWTANDKGLAAAPGRATLIQFDAGLGDRYRFEATVRPGAMSGESPFAGLVVGADAEGDWNCVGLSGDLIEVWRVRNTWERVASPRGLTAEQASSFRLAVEARPRSLLVYVNGELIAEEEFPARSLRGAVGLLVMDASAVFEDVRLSY